MSFEFFICFLQFSLSFFTFRICFVQKEKPVSVQKVNPNEKQSLELKLLIKFFIEMISLFEY